MLVKTCNGTIQGIFRRKFDKHNQLANIKTLSVVMIIAYHGKPALTEPKLIFHL